VAGLLQTFARTRDEGIFRVLYTAATPAMYGLAIRLAGGHTAVAEDVVQEAWIRALDRLHTFDVTRAGGPWFVVNCWRERVRSEAHELQPAHDVIDQQPDDSVTLWSERPLLRDAIGLLPTGFRTVLVLHDIEGYTHAEIGERLGIDQGTSKSQLSRARAQLRRLLSERRNE